MEQIPTTPNSWKEGKAFINLPENRVDGKVLSELSLSSGKGEQGSKVD